MKNIFLIAYIALAMIVVSCEEPLSDLYSDLDEVSTGLVKDVEVTLSDDDYELALPYAETSGDSASLETYKNLSEDQAKKYVPYILDEKYPLFGKGSSAKVTYDLYIGNSSLVSSYTGATSYTVSQSDYASVSVAAGEAGFFNNDKKAADHLPTILAAGISTPAEGDLAAVSFDYAAIAYEDISVTEAFSEDFEDLADLSGYQTISVEGAQVWSTYSSSSGYKAARMNAFSGGNVANEDWLILPEIDLTGYSDAKLRVSHVLNFLGSGVIGTDIAVKISEDYDGTNVGTATWVTLDFDKWPTGSDYDIVDAKADLSAYSGKKVVIGFYFKSTLDYAPQWRVVSISVSEGETISTTKMNEFYEFGTGSWTKVSAGVYYLSSADYDAMGAPGKFDNFSSTDAPANYLPQFLKVKYPFVQEDEQVVIVYKYYSSSAGATQTRGDLYTYSGGAWAVYSSVVAATLTFGNNGTVWVPDNTIKYDLTSDDYKAIGNATVSTNAAGSASVLSYSNFDLGLWTSKQIFDAITARLLEALPNTENGQKYLVKYATWMPGAGFDTIHVIYQDGAYSLVE